MVVPNSWMVMVGKIPLKQMILGYPHLWQPPYPHYLTILMVKELNPIPGAGSEDLRIRESLGKPMFLTLEHHLFRDIFTGCNQPNRMVYSCLFKKILEGQWAMNGFFPASHV